MSIVNSIPAADINIDPTGVTAVAADVRAGKYYIKSDGDYDTGTVTERDSDDVTVGTDGLITAAAGIYSAAAEHQLSNTDDADFVADNIVMNKTIFGITGTGGYNVATGSKTLASGGTISITGLSFTPVGVALVYQGASKALQGNANVCLINIDSNKYGAYHNDTDYKFYAISSPTITKSSGSVTITGFGDSATSTTWYYVVWGY